MRSAATARHKGRLFGRAICDAKGQPLLSWRVELLPYLGQQALYDQFDLTQPWDSARNLPFAKLIPERLSIARTIRRQDELPGTRRILYPFRQLTGMSLRKFEDGPENTIVLLEVRRRGRRCMDEARRPEHQLDGDRPAIRKPAGKRFLCRVGRRFSHARGCGANRSRLEGDSSATMVATCSPRTLYGHQRAPPRPSQIDTRGDVVAPHSDRKTRGGGTRRRDTERRRQQPAGAYDRPAPAATACPRHTEPPTGS